MDPLISGHVLVSAPPKMRPKEECVVCLPSGTLRGQTKILHLHYGHTGLRPLSSLAGFLSLKGRTCFSQESLQDISALQFSSYTC